MGDDVQDIIAMLERQKAAIDTAIAALRGSGESVVESVSARITGRTGAKKAAISEGRRRQIEAMRRYWSEKKAAGGAGTRRKTAKKARGGITPAGRKRLSEMMRNRWAAKRASGKATS